MYRKKPQGWLKHLDFLVLDVIMIQLAYILAYFFRHSKWDVYEQPVYQTGAMLLFIATVCGAFFWNIHKDILRRGAGDEALSVLKTVVTDTTALILFLYMAHIGNVFSRLTLGYFTLAACALLFVTRSFWKFWIRKHIAGNEKRVIRMLLLTTGSIAADTVDRIRKNSLGSAEIIGIVTMDESLKIGDTVEQIGVVTDCGGVSEYMQTRWIDSVMIALPMNMKVPEEILNLCAEMGITSHVCLSITTDRQVMSTVENVCGYTVLTESIRIASSRAMVLKRVMDICGGLVGLFFTGILTIIVGPMIFISDPGSIFFSQTRIGENGRRFKIYKFRSMYKDAEARKQELMAKNKMQGLMFKMDDDPRIIGSGPDGKRHGIGWFIRKTSIDEFPQFWNVLKGDMSLVGTRPPTEAEFEQYEAHHRARLAIRPGLTGLWQVSGRSDITDFEEVVALDLEYINTWTIPGDIRIILKTVGILFSGSGAE